MRLSDKRKQWKHNEYRVPLIICCVIFSMYALSLLYPIVWILLKSFGEDFYKDQARLLPSKYTMSNYELMLTKFDFLPMIKNTILLSLVTPTLQILNCCCISYAYAKFKFKGRGLVYAIALSSMVIPSVGTLAASLQLSAKLGLYNKMYGMMIMCSSGMGFSFLLIGSQYTSVSNEYSEAAEIDGASKFRVFAQIITPQIFPTLVVLWVLSFIGVWNDYATPFLFLPSYPTLSIGIKSLNTAALATGGAQYPVLFAGIIMVEIPVLILFFALQKRILSFSLGGGIKG